MFSKRIINSFVKYRLTNQNNVFRYIRSVIRRGEGPKVVHGKIRTVTEFDDSEHINTYKDLVKSVQKSNLGDELEIERNFLNEDYHGHVFENCENYYDEHISEEKRLKSFIKKGIIGRKYFKIDRETNLLTHAAKQQIKFLHESNPQEWNYKALSECFPISEEGVKRLLKCNFVLKCPQKIKAHDENVARRWKILKSGKFSNEISFLTQKLYKEGKLVDDYFSGNPNLPTAPSPTKKVIELKKNEQVGEFSAIVKTYHDYENKKLLGSEENIEKEVTIRDNNLLEKSKKKKINAKNALKFKIASEEYDDDDTNPEVYITRKKKINNDAEIPFSQFKEILKEENEVNLKSKYKNEYDTFVQQISSTDHGIKSEKEEEPQNCFMKIPKYEKENVDLTFEKDKKFTRIYKYDEKFGYQHPIGKNIRGRITISSKQIKKGKLIKVDKCIYDEDGEFLCKVPT